MTGNSRVAGGERRPSTGKEERRREGKGRESPGGRRAEGQYHRIETLVSPCSEGAPIQTLGNGATPPAGERIQTVEGIRVTGRGSRRGGGASGRPGGAMWYEEEEYLEAQPPSPHPAPPPPLSLPPATAELPAMPPPPPHFLLPPHLHHLPPHALAHPLPPPLPPPPPPPFPMAYHADALQIPPPLHPHHPLPSSPFFTSAPPIPRPPPAPRRLSPPPSHPSAPQSAVMVGGILVPIDRPLPHHRLPRPNSGDRGSVGHRGNRRTPPPLMTSLLGEPPKLPRTGTVKEPFISRHGPALHRPGAPPPLLGRVKEPLSLPLPSPSPSPTSSTASPTTPNSPALDGAPPRSAPPLHNPPPSPPPRRHGPNPLPLLDLPSTGPPMALPRAPSRGRMPSQHFDGGRYRGGKRPAAPYKGGGGGEGAFHPHKRPFQPQRY